MLRAFVFAMIATLAGPAMAQEVPSVVGGTLAETLQAPPARLWMRAQPAAVVPGQTPPPLASPLALVPFVQSHSPIPSSRAMQVGVSRGLVADKRAGQVALEGQPALLALPFGPRRQVSVRGGLLAQVVEAARVAQAAGARNPKEGQEVAWAASAPALAVGAPLSALLPLVRMGENPGPGVGVHAQNRAGTKAAMAPVDLAAAVTGVPFAPLADSARTALLANRSQWPSRPAVATLGVAQALVVGDASAQVALSTVAADVGALEAVRGLAAPLVGVSRALGADMPMAAVVQMEAPSPGPTQGRRPGAVPGDVVGPSDRAHVPASMEVGVAHEAPARGSVQAWNLPVLVAAPTGATPVRLQRHVPLALVASARPVRPAPGQMPEDLPGSGAAPAPAAQLYEWAPNLTAAPIPVALYTVPLPPL